MVHELPGQAGFFAEAARALKSGAQMLVAEPRGHVTKEDFARLSHSPARRGCPWHPSDHQVQSHSALAQAVSPSSVTRLRPSPQVELFE